VMPGARSAPGGSLNPNPQWPFWVQNPDVEAPVIPTGWSLSNAVVIQAGNNTSSTTLAFTTLANVPAAGWIIAGFGSDGQNLSSISCGGLTWVVVVNVNDAPNLIWSAIAYAYAPSGLISGTAGTATYAAATAHKTALGSSFLANPGTTLTASAASNAIAATAAWTSGTGPAAAATGDLTFGFVNRATNAGTTTPDANTTELQDVANLGAGNSSSHYRLATAPGNTPVGGTYSGATAFVGLAVSFAVGTSGSSSATAGGCRYARRALQN
jgi:hypothetical protein